MTKIPGILKPFCVGMLCLSMLLALPVLQAAIAERDGYYGHFNPRTVPALANAAVPEGGLNLVFFGFGDCTESCPIQMTNLLALQDRLTNERIQFVYVSLSPERENQQSLDSRMQQWGPAFRGVVPDTFEQAQRWALDYGSSASRISAGGHQPAITHDARLHVVTPNNVRVVEYLSPALDIARVIKDLELLAQSMSTNT